MIHKNRTAAHPGIVLSEEFLKPLGISQKKLSDHIGVSPACISDIITGRRGISSDMAWWLSQSFGTLPRFWLDIQSMHQLTENRPKKKVGLIDENIKIKDSE